MSARWATRAAKSKSWKAFKRAKGFLRREVGKRIRLRNTPELHFDWDHTLAHADRIHQLIDDLDIPAESAANGDAVR